MSGAAANGPAANGPAANGPAANGPAASGPAARGPAANGPAAQPRSTRCGVRHVVLAAERVSEPLSIVRTSDPDDVDSGERDSSTASRSEAAVLVRRRPRVAMARPHAKGSTVAHQAPQADQPAKRAAAPSCSRRSLKLKQNSRMERRLTKARDAPTRSPMCSGMQPSVTPTVHQPAPSTARCPGAGNMICSGCVRMPYTDATCWKRTPPTATSAARLGCPHARSAECATAITTNWLGPVSRRDMAVPTTTEATPISAALNTSGMHRNQKRMNLTSSDAVASAASWTSRACERATRVSLQLLKLPIVRERARAIPPPSRATSVGRVRRAALAERWQNTCPSKIAERMRRVVRIISAQKSLVANEPWIQMNRLLANHVRGDLDVVQL